MRTLVCGGRNFSDDQFLFRFLDTQSITQIVSGAQRTRAFRHKFGWIGADWLAIEWALAREIPFMGVPAEWKKYGSPAGAIRNAVMTDNYLPERVIAFPGNAGTANMVNLARYAGIPVIYARP